MNTLPLILLVIVGTQGCVSAGKSPADDPAGLVAGDPVAEDYQENRVVCRRQRTAGSHVPVTVCRKESQMKAERDELQEAIGPLRPIAGDSRGLDIQTLPNH